MGILLGPGIFTEVTPSFHLWGAAEEQAWGGTDTEISSSFLSPLGTATRDALLEDRGTRGELCACTPF